MIQYSIVRMHKLWHDEQNKKKNQQPKMERANVDKKK